MPEDASLDDFLSTPSPSDGEKKDGARSSTRDEESRPADRDGEAGPSEDAGDGSGPADDRTATDTPPTTGRIEPATSTSRWVPDGTACPACGDAATRLWRDGDRLVCAGCKAWDDG